MAKRSVLMKNAEEFPRILLGDRPPSYLGKARLATELDIRAFPFQVGSYPHELK
ncbi:Uncharacterised protein [Brucella anthropi]|nr:Uncharacterised protein [Brucella anthropi]